MASSSLAGVTATAFFGGGAAFFLPKSATVLKVTGLEADGAGLDATEKFPSISETPMHAAAEDAAREAIASDGAGKDSFSLWSVNVNAEVTRTTCFLLERWCD